MVAFGIFMDKTEVLLPHHYTKNIGASWLQSAAGQVALA